MKRSPLIDVLPTLGPALGAIGAVLSGESAAHVHLAAATASIPGHSVRYAALIPRRVHAIVPEGARDVPGVERDVGVITEVLRERLPLVSTIVTLADGTSVPTLSREAVIAQLLALGGLAVGLAGTLIHVANVPPIDVDEVREILKAARQGERFQPLLELLDVA